MKNTMLITRLNSWIKWQYCRNRFNLLQQVQPTATAVVIGLQEGFVSEYSVVSVGARYDLDTNVALKVDVSTSSDDINSAGDANLLRVAVNYVF